MDAALPRSGPATSLPAFVPLKAAPKEIVLQQLWGGRDSRPIVDARSTPLGFLTSFNEEVEIVTGAPNYDWELFLRLGL